MRRYVTLHGALWELDQDRYVELLRVISENGPYNLQDYGIRVGIVNLDLTKVTQKKARILLQRPEYQEIPGDRVEEK